MTSDDDLFSADLNHLKGLADTLIHHATNQQLTCVLGWWPECPWTQPPRTAT